MLRWYITGFIAAFMVMQAYVRRGSPYRPGVDTAHELGVIAGAAAAPLLIGIVVAALSGLVMTKSAGGFHRRMNWATVIAFVVLTAFQLSQKAG